jgi:hypothetical protein
MFAIFSQLTDWYLIYDRKVWYIHILEMYTTFIYFLIWIFQDMDACIQAKMIAVFQMNSQCLKQELIIYFPFTVIWASDN